MNGPPQAVVAAADPTLAAERPDLGRDRKSFWITITPSRREDVVKQSHVGSLGEGVWGPSRPGSYRWVNSKGERIVTEELINHFRTLGFIQCKQFFSPEETTVLSDAFDAAMTKGREGAPPPEPGQPRQQINSSIDPFLSFFDLDPEVFYPLLTDDRFVDIFRNLLGEDFVLPISEGILHTGGSGWHHDNVASEGFFTMRAHIYLDHLDPENGCLSVIPGSHFTEYREILVKNIKQMGVRPEEVPGLYPVVNEPGDVIFMNHKLHHSSLSDSPYRRCIHINATKAAESHSVPEQVEALNSRLTNKYTEVRVTAAAALQRLATPEALAALEDYDPSEAIGSE